MAFNLLTARSVEYLARPDAVAELRKSFERLVKLTDKPEVSSEPA